MTAQKLVLAASQHLQARPLRDFLLARGFALLQGSDLSELLRQADKRKPDCIIVDYRLLTAMHNGKLPELPSKAFKVAVAPTGSLAHVQTYLHHGVVHDYLVTPIHKAELGCMLDKLHHFHQQQRQMEKISLEELIELKLKSVLARLDVNQLADLHDLIMPRLERPLIKMVLDQTGGNQLKAASILGINRNTLRSKMKLLHIKQSVAAEAEPR